MRADPRQRPVGRLRRVADRLPTVTDRRNEFVDEVRMRTAVTAALNERQMFGVLDGSRKLPDRLRQQVSEVGNLDLLGDLRLGLLRRVRRPG